MKEVCNYHETVPAEVRREVEESLVDEIDPTREDNDDLGL
jgi:hypothetical protein